MITILREIIARNIKSIRKERGLTQIELAEKSDLNKNTIVRYERSRVNPKLGNLIRISEALGVSLESLMKK